MLQRSAIAAWGLLFGAAFMKSFEKSDIRFAIASHDLTCHSVASPRLATVDPVGGAVKRLVDILLALTFLILFSPLLLFVAALVRLDSPGPVFYGHPRIGHGGRSFRCLKFRTMVTDGDAVLEQHLASVPGARAEWDANRKLRDDPRVTRVGQILRDYSVDELPQLLNVLWGSMSLVGPRPVVQEELDRYAAAASAYLSARPGITGLWQVSGRSDTNYDRRVELDQLYVAEWSFWRDCLILARTVPVVLSARGAC